MLLNPFQELLSQLLPTIRESYSEADMPSAAIKTECYKQVLSYRQDRWLEASEEDAAGFNMLHWAVLCNQTQDAKMLIEQNPLLVNTPSQQSTAMKIWHMTPLLLAAMQGHIYLSSFLLTKNANPAICSKIQVTMKDPLLNYANEGLSPFDEAARRGFHEIVSLLIKPEIIAFHANEKQYGEDDLSSCCCVRIGFTLNEKLAAAEALQKAVKISSSLENLQRLPKHYPPLQNGRLSIIYQAYLAARSYESKSIQYASTSDAGACTIL